MSPRLEWDDEMLSNILRNQGVGSIASLDVTPGCHSFVVLLGFRLFVIKYFLIS